MLSHTDRRPLPAVSSPARPTAYGRIESTSEILAPDALLAAQRELAAAIAPCPPHPTGQIVCADGSSCICPLAGHVTDAERAVMNDISHQASRLARAFALIFALVAVAAMVLVLLR